MYARHKRELQIRCIPLTFHSLGRCNFQTPLHTLSLFISTHCQPEIWMLFHGLLRSWKIQKVVIFEYKLWKIMQNDWIWNVLEKWQGKNSIIRSVLLNYFGPIFMVISQESTRKVLKKFMSTLEILWLQKHTYLMFSAFSWLQFIPALQVDNMEWLYFSCRVWFNGWCPCCALRFGTFPTPQIHFHGGCLCCACLWSSVQ